MKRIALIDFLRALALVFMIGFHLCYDLNVVSGKYVEWQFLPWVKLWQQLNLLCFIFVSGMSFAVRTKGQGEANSEAQLVANNEVQPAAKAETKPAASAKAFLHKHKILLQGLWLLLLGQAITWVTEYFMPSEAIHYGVITFFGSALLFSYLVENKRWQLLRGVGPELGTFLCLGAFLYTYHVQLGYFGLAEWQHKLPGWLYEANYAFWGFPNDDFFSADYVSFIPHIFMYWLGFYAYRLLAARAPQILGWGAFRTFNSLGKHSLVIYFLHQPVLLGVLWLLGLVYGIAYA